MGYKLNSTWKLILILIGVMMLLIIIVTKGVSPFKKTNPGFGLNNFMQELTKKTLTRLVPAVEMYKIINGKYPDSIQQVNYTKDIVDIMDTKAAPKNKPVILYYKNMGEKYQLFSTGFDNIPYTTDDLHPDFSVIDTSKIGLTVRNN